MSLIFYLHFLITFVVLLLATLLILAANPVYSVLFLVIIFVSSAFLLILFGVDFIALLFIIIYVGAIAVLFLFVVMMLDVKSPAFSSNQTQKNLFKILSVLGSFFLIFFETNFIIKDFYLISNYESELDSFSNLDSFGQYLFNFYVPCFIIAGMILLIAMLGAISLTLRYRSFRRKELSTKQLSRTSTFLSSFN